MRREGLPLKRFLAGVAVAATAAAVLGGAALAQIARDGGPIAMGADRLEVIDAEGVQIWSGPDLDALGVDDLEPVRAHGDGAAVAGDLGQRRSAEHGGGRRGHGHAGQEALQGQAFTSHRPVPQCLSRWC